MKYSPWIRSCFSLQLHLLTIILRVSSVICVRGLVENVNFDSKFSCASSNSKEFKVSSEMQCVQKCANNKKCELFNYIDHAKYGGILKNCEVYPLSKHDSSCTVLRGMSGWKCMVFQDTDSCRHMKYNHCFPCECPEVCTAGETINCKCISGSTLLPTMFISFEMENPALNVKYERGVDTDGQSSVQLKRGANIGPSEGRQGNVLRLTELDSGAIVGKFQNHPLNNPNTGYSTFSLWVKVVVAQPETQTLFGSGKPYDNTGLLLRLENSAQIIYAAVVTGNKHVTMTHSVGSTLKSWTHLSLVEYGNSSPALKLYVNGIFIKSGTTSTSYKTDTSGFTQLVIGGDGGLFPLTSSKFDIHIDDFSYWNKVLTDAEIAYVMKGEFANCQGTSK